MKKLWKWWKTEQPLRSIPRARPRTVLFLEPLEERAVPTASITGVAPNSGPMNGATEVVVTGSGFTDANGVSFGGSGTMFSVLSDTELEAWSPMHAAGLVDIQVSTPDGLSPTSSADQFTYNLTSTTTSLFASENPATYGDAVTFTATIASDSETLIDTPTGTVQFEDGTTVLATESVSSGMSGVQATFTTSALAIGAHTITAVYDGDANFAGSSDVCSMVVNPIMVTNLNNTGGGSLRAAITAANAAGGSPEIDFQAGLSGTITLESALPDISSNTDIEGPGAGTITVTRDPNAMATFRIFTVDANTTCTISGLAITGGVADGTNATDGGGVYNYGVLTLSADNLYGNEATNADNGGAICNDRSGTLTVSSCQIYDNGAGNSGGGIFNDGALSINGDSSLTNNGATVGAGIFNSGFGTATIGGYTTIDENTAVQLGGGVANFGSFTMNGGRIDSNNVTGNARAQAGGGYYGEGAGTTATLTGVDLSSDSAGKGGGFYLKGGTTLSLSGCTISNNTAALANGGYYDSVASYTPTNCTITDTIVKGP